MFKLPQSTQRSSFSINPSGNNLHDLGARKEAIKNACLECHTQDQSPEWYQRTVQGAAGALDEIKFKLLYKKMSCPAYVAE